VKKTVKKAIVKGRTITSKKGPSKKSGKGILPLIVSSDIEVLSDSINSMLTISPEKKKSSLSASIDSFLMSTSSSSMKGKKRLTPTKELSDNGIALEENVDSPVKKIVTKIASKKKPAAKRAKAASKPKAKSIRKKKEILTIDSSEEDEPMLEDSENELNSVESIDVSARPKRSGRSRQTKTNYAVDLEASDALIDSSEEESDFE